MLPILGVPWVEFEKYVEFESCCPEGLGGVFCGAIDKVAPCPLFLLLNSPLVGLFDLKFKSSGDWLRLVGWDMNFFFRRDLEAALFVLVGIKTFVLTFV